MVQPAVSMTMIMLLPSVWIESLLTLSAIIEVRRPCCNPNCEGNEDGKQMENKGTRGSQTEEEKVGGASRVEGKISCIQYPCTLCKQRTKSLIKIQYTHVDCARRKILFLASILPAHCSKLDGVDVENLQIYSVPTAALSALIRDTFLTSQIMFGQKFGRSDNSVGYMQIPARV